MTRHLKYMEVEPDLTRLGIEYGNYNTFPIPYKELTLEQGLLEMHTDHMGAADMYDNKQCKIPDDDGSVWNVSVYIWLDKAIAVAKAYTWDRERDEENGRTVGKGTFLYRYRDLSEADYADKAGYFLRFYRIGCTHPNLKELSQAETRQRGVSHYGMHDHYYECPDCGFTRRTDSSG